MVPTRKRPKATRSGPDTGATRSAEAQALPELVHVLGPVVYGQEEQHGIAAQWHQEEDGREREEHHHQGLPDAGEEISARRGSLPDHQAAGGKTGLEILDR